MAVGEELAAEREGLAILGREGQQEPREQAQCIRGTQRGGSGTGAASEGGLWEKAGLGSLWGMGDGKPANANGLCKDPGSFG